MTRRWQRIGNVATCRRPHPCHRQPMDKLPHIHEQLIHTRHYCSHGNDCNRLQHHRRDNTWHIATMARPLWRLDTGRIVRSARTTNTAFHPHRVDYTTRRVRLARFSAALQHRNNDGSNVATHTRLPRNGCTGMRHCPQHAHRTEYMLIAKCTRILNQRHHHASRKHVWLGGHHQLHSSHKILLFDIYRPGPQRH